MTPAPSAKDRQPCLYSIRTALYHIKNVLGVLAPFYLSPILFLGTQTSQGAYTVLVVAVMTILEALPLPVVALLLIAAGPFIKSRAIKPYIDNYQVEMVSMIGLLSVYVAVDATHLWTRISLLLLRWQGPRLQRLFFFVMVFTFCASLLLPSSFVTLLLAALISRTVHNIQARH